MVKFLNEQAVVVGSYNPESLLSRLKEGTQRQLSFCRIFSQEQPDLAISHGSADQCRVAFGLGIPVISTVDTPYAEAVHRLTLPLSNYIVASRSIPKRILERYNVAAEIVDFDSVDEVAWIKDEKPRAHYDFGHPLIVVRPIEEGAAYTKEKLDLSDLANRLTTLGNVVYLSRYDRKRIKNLIVPKGFVDSTNLVAHSDLFVGFGGTITREAALQGAPAIIIDMFPGQYVNNYLVKKGFPIFRTKKSGAFRLAEKLLNKKYDVRHLLNKLENPVDTIATIVQSKCKGARPNP
jgi:predicted glycosyltransferase